MTTIPAKSLSFQAKNLIFTPWESFFLVLAAEFLKNAIMDAGMKNFYQRVYELVARIPEGRVMTYGQIAVLLGRPTAARAVGYALHQLAPNSGIPWHRVINAQGKVSPRSAAEIHHEPSLQQLLLEQEGLPFDATGKIDLKTFLWEQDSLEEASWQPSKAALSSFLS